MPMTIADETADRRINGSALLYGIPVLAFVAYLFLSRHINPFLEDTPGYINFTYDRPAGYGLLLGAARILGGNEAVLIAPQLALLCAALGYLAITVHRLTGFLAAALVLELALFANPGLFHYASTLMSEGMSAAVIACFVAVLLLMTMRPTPGPAITLASLAAIAITLRPINIILIPVALLAIFLLCKQNRMHTIAIGLALAVAAYALTPAVHALRHDPPVVGSPLSRGLFQKTLFRQWPRTETLAQCDGDLVAQRTQAVDAYMEKVPKRFQDVLQYHFSGYLRFQVIIPEMMAIHGFQNPSATDSNLLCIWKQDFKNAPGYFIKDAANQAWLLLDYFTFLTSAQLGDLQHFVAENPPPLPPRFNASTSGPPFELPSARPALLAIAFRLFQLLAAIILLLAPIVAVVPRWRRPTVLVLALLGIVFWGQMVPTAFIELAEARYMYPLWPVSCIAVFFVALFLCRRFAPAGLRLAGR